MTDLQVPKTVSLNNWFTGTKVLYQLMTDLQVPKTGVC